MANYTNPLITVTAGGKITNNSHADLVKAGVQIKRKATLEEVLAACEAAKVTPREVTTFAALTPQQRAAYTRKANARTEARVKAALAAN